MTSDPSRLNGWLLIPSAWKEKDEKHSSSSMSSSVTIDEDEEFTGVCQ
eukprot:CAMPEP_0203733062 /NCGR_PEP_ID=MMETSP0092-20131115/26597_1 /ASSEMBLY_ACC=CAM_ASM_001090 /TAXON_ID=426623 /ORGANISM="Chaetoceros affinis, Strain CCMP159" /LENGTH=47 /DNA_ID= /DNA_START= /DNA_END= /DNA_ORIENTATION=